MQDPARWVNRWILVPLVAGTSALAWGEAVLFAASRGAIHPQDPLTDMYLTLIGGYFSGIEVRKWTQKDLPDPAQDDLLERAQRAGLLAIAWWGLYLVLHLWQFHDPTVVIPETVKPIAKAVILLLIGKHISRTVRHSRRGVGGALGQADEEPSTQNRVHEALSKAAAGLTFQEIESALPDTSRSHIARVLQALQKDGRIERQGIPRSRDARYKVHG